MDNSKTKKIQSLLFVNLSKFVYSQDLSNCITEIQGGNRVVRVIKI